MIQYYRRQRDGIRTQTQGPLYPRSQELRDLGYLGLFRATFASHGLPRIDIHHALPRTTFSGGFTTATTLSRHPSPLTKMLEKVVLNSHRKDLELVRIMDWVTCNFAMGYDS
jgi:hypothetical protein